MRKLGLGDLGECTDTALDLFAKAAEPVLDGDAELEDFIRQTASTIWHTSSTCRMGPDDGAVVAPDLLGPVLVGQLEVRARVQHEVAEQMTAQLTALRPPALVGRLPEPVAIQYMAAAQVGLAQWWLENEMPFPPEQAAMYLMSLHMNGGLWALGLQPD